MAAHRGTTTPTNTRSDEPAYDEVDEARARDDEAASRDGTAYRDETGARDGTAYRDETGVRHETGVRDETAVHDEAVARDEAAVRHHNLARRRFGGTNWGSCFFGWLVAIALTIVLTSIIGAVLAAVGSSTHVTQSDAQRQAGTIGVAAAITLVVVLVIGYYAGGYVAGRMSRFDGARQGLGVWLIGLAVTALAIALGAVFGHQYNLLDRVDLPRIPISTEQLGWGALVTAVAVLLGTVLAAALGGVVGRRYHARVDDAVAP